MGKKKQIIIYLPLPLVQVHFFRKLFGEPVCLSSKGLANLLFEPAEAKQLTMLYEPAEEKKEDYLKVLLPQHFARLTNLLEISIRLKNVYRQHFFTFVSAQQAMGVPQQTAIENFFNFLEVEGNIESSARDFRRFKNRVM